MKKAFFIFFTAVFALQLNGQYKIPGIPSTSFTHSYAGKNGLTLIYMSKTDNITGKYHYKYLCLDLQSNEFKEGDVFADDFYKKYKQYKSFDLTYKYNQYYVNIGDEEIFGNSNEKKLIAVFDMDNLVNYEFEIEGEKGKTTSVLNIAGNKNELILFVSKSQATYWSGEKLETTYYIYQYNISENTMEEREFTLKNADLSIMNALGSVSDTKVLVSYYHKGTGYALMDLNSLELTGIPVSSDKYPYIHSTSAIHLDNGLLFITILGTSTEQKECAYSFITTDGEINQLENQKSENISVYKQRAKEEPVIIGNSLYTFWIDNKSLSVVRVSANGSKIFNVDLGGNYEIAQLLELSESKITLLGNKGSKKYTIDLNIQDMSAMVTPADHLKDFDFNTLRYLNNGHTELIFYKLSKTQANFEKQPPLK